MSKIIRIYLIFFISLKNKILGAHFLLKLFFGNFNFKNTFLPKSGPIFDEAAKLGKASKDAYYSGLQLILLDLLKNLFAKGIASKVNDFITHVREYFKVQISFTLFQNILVKSFEFQFVLAKLTIVR